MDNFEKHKDKVVRDAIRMVKHVKITFWFRRYIRCKGPERENRNELFIRNSLSFLSNGRMQEAETSSESTLRRFMKDWVESQLLQFKFKAACKKIAKIVSKVRVLKEVR